MKSLHEISSWGYYIENPDKEVIHNSKYDLMVIDLQDANGALVTPEEIQYMKEKNDKIILCYISLGEAEDYRWYWKKEWERHPPPWLGSENIEWKGNYPVQFWNSEWITITQDMLHKVLDAGFDGVYIDKVDVYEDLGGSKDLREKMVAYIVGVSEFLKSRKKDFLVFVQNAEELVEDEHYINAVDGIGKESLCYINSHWNEDFDESLDYLIKWEECNKTVLCVEYLTRRTTYDYCEDIFLENGFIGYMGPRDLDILVEEHI